MRVVRTRERGEECQFWLTKVLQKQEPQALLGIRSRTTRLTGGDDSASASVGGGIYPFGLGQAGVEDRWLS
jgi:hypothetical protein